MMTMPLLFTILVEPIWETRPFTFKSSFLTSWGNQTPLFADESLRGQSKRLLLAVASLMRQAERAGATIAYSGENDHLFRAMAITQTGAKRSVKG